MNWSPLSDNLPQIGVSGIVPMVYSIAGTNTKVAPGIAIAMVSGVSYFGFLMGPPLIGYISALSSLQYSYAIIGCFGLVITLLVAKIIVGFSACGLIGGEFIAGRNQGHTLFGCAPDL